MGVFALEPNFRGCTLKRCSMEMTANEPLTKDHPFLNIVFIMNKKMYMPRAHLRKGALRPHYY